jgi:hypothetical protein
MKTVAERLLVKAGARVRILNAGPAEVALLGLPDNATIAASGDPVDVVVLFVRDAAELRTHLPAAAAAADGDRLLWLAYPKRSSGVDTDLGRDAITPLTDQLAGLTGITLISIDSTWSAMRLRPSSRYH